MDATKKNLVSNRDLLAAAYTAPQEILTLWTVQHVVQCALYLTSDPCLTEVV